MGRRPVRRFWDKTRWIDKNERPKICLGMALVRLLLESWSEIKDLHLLRLDGMLPQRLFSPKRSWSNKVKFPRECGMLPKRLFHDRFNIFNLWSLPIAAGMLPDTWFPSKLSNSRLTTFKIPLGIIPAILLCDIINILRVNDKWLMHSAKTPPKLLVCFVKTSNVVA